MHEPDGLGVAYTRVIKILRVERKKSSACLDNESFLRECRDKTGPGLKSATIRANLIFIRETSLLPGIKLLLGVNLDMDLISYLLICKVWKYLRLFAVSCSCFASIVDLMVYEVMVVKRMDSLCSGLVVKRMDDLSHILPSSVISYQLSAHIPDLNLIYSIIFRVK